MTARQHAKFLKSKSPRWQLRCLSAVGLFWLFLCLPTLLWAQSIKLQSDANKIYVDMPFVLKVIVEGLSESPEPQIEPFEIPNASIQFMGMSPRISSMTRIINGQRTDRREVQFIYSYQITPQRTGIYEIPIIRATQGQKTVQSTGRASFDALEVTSSRDMLIEVEMPERPLWVGERFELTLKWLLRKNTANYNLNLPFLDMPEIFEVEEHNQRNPHDAGLNINGRSYKFVTNSASVLRDGLEYKQFEIKIPLIARKSGRYALPASTAIANLEIGEDPWDSGFFGFGFGQLQYEPVKAQDRPRNIEVRELPQQQKPASFVNAMGTHFEIQTKVDRSFVKVGDPLLLTIDIVSSNANEGLILPSLVDMGLNEQLFSVSTEEPIGENIDGPMGMKIRRFQIPVRVKSERVSELPPLAFSYFDTQREQYQTQRSQPIALAVSTVDKIGANDVIQAKPLAPTQGEASEEGPERSDSQASLPSSLDLGLASSQWQPSEEPWYLRRLLFIQIGLYLLPWLFGFVLIFYQRRRSQRDEEQEQREAMKAFKAALIAAKVKSARDSAGALTNSLTQLLQQTDSEREPFVPFFEELSASAYHPEAQSKKLDPSLLKRLKECTMSKINPRYAQLLSRILLLLLSVAFAGLSAMPAAWAQTREAEFTTERSLLARQYQEAMALEERSARVAQFQAVAEGYRQWTERYPKAVLLYVDWGNACLNASNLGCASLAYHRALRLEPGQKQARANLSYIQALLGERATGNDTLSALFFLNDQFSSDLRLLWAAIFFAIFGLLLLPWHPNHKRLLRALAILPALLWLWLLASIFYAPKDETLAVVMQESQLKTADHAQASQSVGGLLLPGQTVQVLENRQEWCNVQRSDASQGWLRCSQIEKIH